MILKGKKVTLRAIEREDLEFLREMINDPELEYMTDGFSLPISKEQQERWYEKNMYSSDPVRWIIETEKDGVVGLMSIEGLDWKNRVVHNIGIKLRTEKISEPGVAIDAHMTLFDYVFNELNMNRIEGKYLEDNVQSAAMNKLLYKVEGRQRQAVYKKGRYIDLILVALLKSDYIELKNRRKRRA